MTQSKDTIEPQTDIKVEMSLFGIGKQTIHLKRKINLSIMAQT